MTEVGMLPLALAIILASAILELATRFRHWRRRRKARRFFVVEPDEALYDNPAWDLPGRRKVGKR